MEPTTFATVEITLQRFVEELKQVRQARIDADEKETRIFAELAELGLHPRRAAAPSGDLAQKVRLRFEASLPLPKNSKSAQLVGLLETRPRADLSWLTKRAYGKDDAKNRQALSAMLHYLVKTRRLAHVGPALYEVIRHQRQERAKAEGSF